MAMKLVHEEYLKLSGRTSIINLIVLLVFHLNVILIDNGSSASVMISSTQTTTRRRIIDHEFKVGVVLDLKLPITKVWLTSMNMALSDFYSYTKTSRKRRLVLHVADSNADILDASFAAINLIQNDEVQAIIGPMTSAEAIYMLHLGKKTQIPIISFTATSPSISPSRNPYFIRTTHQDSSQVDAIASVVKTFKWREVVPIYEDTEYGNGVIPYLIDAFHSISTRVPYRSVLPESANDDRILQELYKLMTMQTRVFILHMTTPLGVRIFEKAKSIGMMSKGYVWIVTDGLGDYLSSFNSSVLAKMQGVIGIRRYVHKSSKLSSFKSRWKKKFRKDNPDIKKSLDIYGILAYDTIWLLANAIEKFEALDSRFVKQNVGENSSSHVARLGISQIGPKLLHEISNIKFEGLSGDFGLVDRQLHVHTFHILNVFGNGVREIGIWTPSDGIIKDISLSGTREDQYLLPAHDNLHRIIWPGNTTAIPKGWINPTGEKKLRIGIPVRSSYTEFVKVTRNPSSNDSADVTGYCIDVFNAAIGMLPYAVTYEFIPFQNANHTAAGTYNDLIYQVYLQNFDAVVGDVTITANRLQYVDFTLPYVEAGASMIVLTRKDLNKETLIFFLPLEWRLWMTIVAFFVYIGSVIWILEHRGNQEKVLSSPGRFVMILWILAVFILTASYTASYSAMLMANRFQPTFSDVNLLIKNGYNVGYRNGSFIQGMLKQMGFDESNLKGYGTPEECDEAFSRKRQDGGIVAAFDELPYIELLLAQYCDKYTKVGDIYPTGGFGFVFPKGSPLGLDISRTILSVREDKEKMKRIRNAWLESKRSCSDHDSLGSSYGLTLYSFRYLFVFVGVLSLIPLLADLLNFLYKNRIILTCPNTSISQKIVRLVEKFNEEDEKRLRYYEYHAGIGSQTVAGEDTE
ncbi:glutamate receptor 2.7-like isoform X2 [Papaver somniferum]|uniref:glutamate receptor 2.7-like isoform X2 n=1 Tax=Papaver somniferum TaxID=3469 RepID=UPI000E6FB7A6|nr:glutamate receptor 2.7-like isoform X2 [Papaver somniferum]